jgi:hypothetical protein
MLRIVPLRIAQEAETFSGNFHDALCVDWLGLGLIAFSALPATFLTIFIPAVTVPVAISITILVAIVLITVVPVAIAIPLLEPEMRRGASNNRGSAAVLRLRRLRRRLSGGRRCRC